MDLGVPAAWTGQSLAELNIRSRYGVSVIGIREVDGVNINPAPEEKLQDGDILIVLGDNSQLKKIREMEA